MSYRMIVSGGMYAGNGPRSTDHLGTDTTRPSSLPFGLAIDPKSVQYTFVSSTAICWGKFTKPATGVGTPPQPAMAHFATRPAPSGTDPASSMVPQSV